MAVEHLPVSWYQIHPSIDFCPEFVIFEMVCHVPSHVSLFMLFPMIAFIRACDIQVRLKSETDKPFKFHLVVEAAKYWSDQLIVTGKTERQADGSFSNYHVFHVKGEKCDEKNWHVFVWGLENGSTLSAPVWKIADHRKFKMESISFVLIKLPSYIYITVKQDLKMTIGPRFGVIWCEHC
ncbi:unnamed protein product [Litomosoides sigmodontis]|uniref:Uncharacterized protein n=1 Tax=Litomosoides sigmodontis TaxID=42156 RepID=A0A3P6UD68_LITSI|nr:unnamed protein product [Litomosoides sigmodontis]